MMRKLFFLAVFFTLSCYAQETKQEPIAVIKGDGFEFKIDTNAFKKEIVKHLFSGQEVEFNSFEIKKQFTLGTKREFYYLLLTDTKRHIKVAKWLNKQGNNLFTNDEIGEGDAFEQTYLTCQGINDCDPNVFEEGKDIGWLCGEELSCLAMPEKDELKCKATKSLILFDDTE